MSEAANMQTKDISVLNNYMYGQGHSQDFSRGGVTLCQTDGSHQIVAFCHLNIVGCLLKNRLTKMGSRAPQHPPLATPLMVIYYIQ